MTDIDLKNPEHLAAVVERQKRAFNKPCFRLVAIDTNGVLVRHDYEVLSTAISEAKDFWVNKGFLAVEVFHIESGEDGNNIVVDYHGLRNY